jgi:hypothetical protein
MIFFRPGPKFGSPALVAKIKKARVDFLVNLDTSPKYRNLVDLVYDNCVSGLSLL